MSLFQVEEDWACSEAFGELQELADVLNGAVGATRAACDAGWVPSNFQVDKRELLSPRICILRLEYQVLVSIFTRNCKCQNCSGY